MHMGRINRRFGPARLPATAVLVMRAMRINEDLAKPAREICIGRGASAPIGGNDAASGGPQSVSSISVRTWSSSFTSSGAAAMRSRSR